MSGRTAALERFQRELARIRESGLEKAERVLSTPQGPHVGVAEGRKVLNLCANNYLGLANHPRVREAARAAMDQWGFGLASVRFICGTQTIHKQLEQKLSTLLGTDAAILYSSAFDANGGLFETLLGPEDAVISDELNHASIIDGIRLCKARRYRYANNDMADLEARLKEADANGARTKLITTDGVFSMDGHVAQLDKVCDLAERYAALVHFDDAHATGFMGPTGRGTHELRGCMDRVDITTGTLGKALGGASGGYTAGHRAIIDLLRQRSRPYLFSNALAPSLAAGTMAAIDLAHGSSELRDRLAGNTAHFRERLASSGFQILPGDHPITPIMLRDARPAAAMAERLLARGVYVIAFSYPVVPKGAARIRVQVSAAHSRDELDFAVEQFAQVKQEMGL